MRQTELLRRLRRTARAQGVELVFVRAGGNHDIYRFGAQVQLTIPRHAEINELTARAILRQCGAE